MDGTLKVEGNNLYLVRDSELQRFGYALPNSRKRKAADTEQGEQTTQKAQRHRDTNQKANTFQLPEVPASVL